MFTGAELNKIESQCLGCNKWYKDDIGVLQHHNRNALCKQWTSILLKDNESCQIQEMYNNEDNLVCRICKKTFSNMGNLNKHFMRNIICQKLFTHSNHLSFNGYKDETDHRPKDEGILVQSTTPNHGGAPYVNNSALVHIIWNLFITDKSQLENLNEEIKDKKISLAIAILPSKDNINHLELSDKVETFIIEYGENHNMVIEDDILESYENCYERIKSLQIEGKNIMIFCNNGYQRTIPFLCNYLIKHHLDEVSDLDRALDIILSQVDEANGMEDKALTKANLLKLIKEDSSKLFEN
jgi:flagellar biosynthesis regulator FlaF